MKAPTFECALEISYRLKDRAPLSPLTAIPHIFNSRGVTSPRLDVLGEKYPKPQAGLHTLAPSQPSLLRVFFCSVNLDIVTLPINEIMYLEWILLGAGEGHESNVSNSHSS